MSEYSEGDDMPEAGPSHVGVLHVWLAACVVVGIGLGYQGFGLYVFEVYSEMTYVPYFVAFAVLVIGVPVAHIIGWHVWRRRLARVNRRPIRAQRTIAIAYLVVGVVLTALLLVLLLSLS